MLDTYKNIKLLRKKNKWTQEELATRMGYTDRSSIAKIESGKVDLSRSKIFEFAKVFGVSPSDLMGDDGIEDNDAYEQLLNIYSRNIAMQASDQELLDLFHNMYPEAQESVVQLIKSLQRQPDVPHLKNEKPQ